MVKFCMAGQEYYNVTAFAGSSEARNKVTIPVNDQQLNDLCFDYGYYAPYGVRDSNVNSDISICAIKSTTNQNPKIKVFDQEAHASLVRAINNVYDNFSPGKCVFYKYYVEHLGKVLPFINETSICDFPEKQCFNPDSDSEQTLESNLEKEEPAGQDSSNLFCITLGVAEGVLMASTIVPIAIFHIPAGLTLGALTFFAGYETLVNQCECALQISECDELTLMAGRNALLGFGHNPYFA